MKSFVKDVMQVLHGFCHKCAPWTGTVAIWQQIENMTKPPLSNFFLCHIVIALDLDKILGEKVFFKRF